MSSTSGYLQDIQKILLGVIPGTFLTSQDIYKTESDKSYYDELTILLQFCENIQR